MTSAGDRLSSLRAGDLRRLHAEGVAPDPTVLHGVVDGTVLTGSLALPGIRHLGVWRGKVFEHDAGAVGGRNRLGLGPLEVRRFRFTARVGASSFDDRDVLLLDHDHVGNPDIVRRFHDELVQVDDGLFLATSHHRKGTALRYLATFALALD